MEIAEKNVQRAKKFDLEERTFGFARDVRNFLSQLSSQEVTPEDRKQLIRSSGSVGANYIEANEALSRKDFVMRIKICRKEAKESHFWLRLIEPASPKSIQIKELLIRESTELENIFGAIIKKCLFNLKSSEQ